MGRCRRWGGVWCRRWGGAHRLLRRYCPPALIAFYPLLHPGLYLLPFASPSLMFILVPPSPYHNRGFLISITEDSIPQVLTTVVDISSVQSNHNEKRLSPLCDSLAATMMGETCRVCYSASSDWPRVMPSLYLVTKTPTLASSWPSQFYNRSWWCQSERMMWRSRWSMMMWISSWCQND